jgi:hypothetical protein
LRESQADKGRNQEKLINGSDEACYNECSTGNLIDFFSVWQEKYPFLQPDDIGGVRLIQIGDALRTKNRGAVSLHTYRN